MVLYIIMLLVVALQRIVENQCFNQLAVEYKSALNSVVIKCRCLQYHRRLTAQRALQSFRYQGFDSRCRVISELSYLHFLPHLQSNW